MLQRKTNTAPNRYPGIFRTARALISETYGPDLNGARLRILSFGCSSGGEVFSIRAYFPDAEIFACDCNKKVLREAAKNLRDDPAHLFYSTPEAIAENGPFDLVFAMSVFCQSPASTKVTNLQAIYPFQLFEDLAGNLSENLRPGGLFSIINCNYLFRDLPFATQYQAVRSPLIAGNGFIDKFARDGSRLTTSFGNKRLYSHRAHGTGLTDDDLRDCLYRRHEGTPLEVESHLRLTPPPDLQPDGTARLGGEDIEQARREQRIAMDLQGQLWRDDAGECWLRREWHKASLAGGQLQFGGWWVPAGSHFPGDSGDAQSRQSQHLRQFLSKPSWLPAFLRGR